MEKHEVMTALLEHHCNNNPDGARLDLYMVTGLISGIVKRGPVPGTYCMRTTLRHQNTGEIKNADLEFTPDAIMMVQVPVESRIEMPPNDIDTFLRKRQP